MGRDVSASVEGNPAMGKEGTGRGLDTAGKMGSDEKEWIQAMSVIGSILCEATTTTGGKASP